MGKPYSKVTLDSDKVGNEELLWLASSGWFLGINGWTVLSAEDLFAQVYITFLFCFLFLKIFFYYITHCALMNVMEDCLEHLNTYHRLSNQIYSTTYLQKPVPLDEDYLWVEIRNILLVNDDRATSVSINIQKYLDTWQSTCSRININIMTVIYIVTTAQNNKYPLFLSVLLIGLKTLLLHSCTALTWLASHCIVGTLVSGHMILRCLGNHLRVWLKMKAKGGNNFVAMH